MRPHEKKKKILGDYLDFMSKQTPSTLPSKQLQQFEIISEYLYGIYLMGFSEALETKIDLNEILQNGNNKTNPEG